MHIFILGPIFEFESLLQCLIGLICFTRSLFAQSIISSRVVISSGFYIFEYKKNRWKKSIIKVVVIIVCWQSYTSDRTTQVRKQLMSATPAHATASHNMAILSAICGQQGSHLHFRLAIVTIWYKTAKNWWFYDKSSCRPYNSLWPYLF